MVAGPDFVYVAVPRTASIAIARFWLPLYGGAELPRGHHRREVPPEHDGKFTWAVVRNPYERMLSLWRLFYLRRSKEAFGDFLRHCINRPDRKVLMNQSRFLELARIDQVVRYEHLAADLGALPFVEQWHPVPRENTSEKPYPERRLRCPLPREHCWTAEERRLVEEHSWEDFSHFGYEKTSSASAIRK
jgi:hypothetical protein